MLPRYVTSDPLASRAPGEPPESAVDHRLERLRTRRIEAGNRVQAQLGDRA